MKDKKLTDSEIVKALECCSTASCISNKCHYEKLHDIPTCTTKLTKDALDLINRLQAELDEYKKIKTTINEFWEILLTLSLFKRKEKPTLEEFAEAIQEIKAEAYKECIEILKGRANVEQIVAIDGEWAISQRMANNLLKELVGEQPPLNDVKCIDCEYLELELPYAVCSKAYKGIVAPDDSCGKGKLKEMVGEDK